MFGPEGEEVARGVSRRRSIAFDYQGAAGNDRSVVFFLAIRKEQQTRLRNKTARYYVIDVDVPLRLHQVGCSTVDYAVAFFCY